MSKGEGFKACSPRSRVKEIFTDDQHLDLSMSTHMGRRSTLGIDPVIMSCGQWHRQKVSIEAEKHS